MLTLGEISDFTQDANTQEAVNATYPAADDFKREERRNEMSETQPFKMQSHRLSESCFYNSYIASRFPIKYTPPPQLAIIRPNKTSADFLSARVFLFRKTRFG